MGQPCPMSLCVGAGSQHHTGCTVRGCCFCQSFSIFREFFVSNFPSAGKPMCSKEQSSDSPTLAVSGVTKVPPHKCHLSSGQVPAVPLSCWMHELSSQPRGPEQAALAQACVQDLFIHGGGPGVGRGV